MIAKDRQVEGHVPPLLVHLRHGVCQVVAADFILVLEFQKLLSTMALQRKASEISCSRERKETQEIDQRSGGVAYRHVHEDVRSLVSSE